MRGDVGGRLVREANAEQLAVIRHGHGPVRIMAGAGTGKTFTVTQRVLRLIEEGMARPDEILALTFTNKAAAEMRERITAGCVELGIPADDEPVTVLTYNSFGASIVSEWGGLIGLPPSPTLLSEADRWLTLWDCLPRIDFRSIDLMHLRSPYGSPLPNILKLSGRLKDELVTPERFFEYLETDSEDETLVGEQRARLADYARALLVYEAEKRKQGTLDFGDQIALAVRALGVPEVRTAHKERYRFVLVDEYQDTNFAQSAMVQLLVRDFQHRNVCVVGDIRQAIYRFRGAAPDNLLRFAGDFSETSSYPLLSNYRSTRQILDAANAVWEERDADLISAGGREGLPVIACSCQDPESEWEWIAGKIREQHEAGVAYREMAVLVRKSEMKRQAWNGLMDRGIPAIMSGGTDLFRTPEVRELLSYLRALTRPSDNVSLAHIAASDSFGLDEAALYGLIGQLPRQRSLFDVLVERAADPSAPHDLRLFLATFQRLLIDAATLSPARVVERVIGLRRGAYSDLQRANVYRFHTVAEEFCIDRSRGSSIGAFVAYLNLLLSAPSDQDREEATDLTEEDAVQVLTVHKAKGLEWPVVFVATASEADFRMGNNADLLPIGLRHTAEGMPIPEDFSGTKRYSAAVKKWEKEEHDLEERRILYVALTRAQDRLHISWHRLPLFYGRERVPLKTLDNVLPLTDRQSFGRDDWQEPEETAPGPLEVARRFARMQAKTWAGWRAEEFEGGLAEQIEDAWKHYLAEEELPAQGIDVLRSGLRRWYTEREQVGSLLARCLNPIPRPADADRRPVIEAPSTLSYTMLAAYQDCGRKAYLKFVLGFPGEPRPYATGPGTAFHAAVEATAGEISGAPSFEGLVSSFSEAAAEAHGVEKHQPTAPEYAMLRAFWESPDRLATAISVEQEFYWRVGPGYLHGFIDRIQRCPDGTIELVDFKTSRETLTQEEAGTNLQLLIYALAAREALDISLDRLTLVYPRLGKRVSVTYSEEELIEGRRRIVGLMERARTASYEEVDTRHCPLCEYKLICPAAVRM